jgi:hypothetical protein
VNTSGDALEEMIVVGPSDRQALLQLDLGVYCDLPIGIWNWAQPGQTASQSQTAPFLDPQESEALMHHD